MRHKHLILALGTVLLLSLVGVGCDDGPAVSTVSRKSFRRKARKAKVPKLTVQKPVIEFIYSPIGKRDPFRPYYLDMAGGPGKGTATGPKLTTAPKTDLEKYDIDQLKLVAIITGIAEPVAMVETGDGMGYVVRRGTLIGKNRGRVTRITRNAMIISEVYRDFTGKRIVNPIVKRIRPTKGGRLRGRFVVGGRRVFLDESGRLRVMRIGLPDGSLGGRPRASGGARPGSRHRPPPRRRPTRRP